jgi:hypothetical protein
MCAHPDFVPPSKQEVSNITHKCMLWRMQHGDKLICCIKLTSLLLLLLLPLSMLLKLLSSAMPPAGRPVSTSAGDPIASRPQCSDGSRCRIPGASPSCCLP